MKPLFVRILAPLVAFCIAAPLAAQSDARPTVAVMYFTDGAIGAAHAELEPLSAGIADLLITELSSNPGIRVVERDNLRKLMDEQHLSTSGRVDRETAVRVGKILGAHHMIFGGFVTDGRGTMRLDARAVNVETSEIEHVESVQGKQDDLMALIDDLAQKLNRGMKLPPIPKAVREANADAAKKVPFQATMLYSRALAAKDGGNRAEAVQLLQKSLASFPEYAPAKRELEKLQ
ncbi:MAG TPA: CsgG/HfaB family protein [Gemmatimonadaceae bacterium]